MKKLLTLSGLILVATLFAPKDARADGTSYPTLVVSSVTGQQFSYQVPVSTNIGGILVSNGSQFNWANTVTPTTTAATTANFPQLPSLNLAQLRAVSPASLGQVVICGDCAQTNLCISSGLLSGAWTAVSSTATGARNVGLCN